MANLLFVWLSRSVLVNDIVFYNTYSEQLTYDRSMKLFEQLNSIAWIIYLISPVILFIKFASISILIYTGIVFYNIQDKISLGSIFKIAIASEMVFVLASASKFLWFYLFAGNYDLDDLGFFYPLSLINFFNPQEVSRHWYYPLQSINLFHLGYILSLSYGITKTCSIDYEESEKVVLISYLPGFALWLALTIFLTIDSNL